MPNFNGSPKPHGSSTEKAPAREFSPEEKEQYSSLSARFFNKAHDFEVQDIEDTEWDKTLTVAEGELRSFNFPGSTKMAQEDPTRLNTAQRVLIQQLEGAIHYEQNRKLFSPEMRPALEDRYKEVRQLFVETGERLYPDVKLPASAEVALRRVKNQAAALSNPILKDVFRDLYISNADSLRGADPAKLLQQVEGALYRASGSYESAQAAKIPNNAKELAAFAKSLYLLEVLRQDLERRVEAHERVGSTEADQDREISLWGGAAGNDEGYTKAVDSERLRAARERLGMPDVTTTKKPEEAPRKIIDLILLDREYKTTFSRLDASLQDKSAFDREYTPAIQQQLKTWLENQVVSKIHSKRDPGNRYPDNITPMNSPLSMPLVQRIIEKKTGNIVSEAELARMAFGDFAREYLDADLPPNYGETFVFVRR